jgi:transposase
VAAWQKSGKSADEFAASRGIAPRTLTWWKWRLASRAPSPAPASLRLVPIQIEPAPLTPPSADATPAWEIVTARGHVLRVHRGITAAELGAVLAALDLTEPRR